MLIDWFTVGAQALNFPGSGLGPEAVFLQAVLDAIAAREKHIAATIAAAESQKDALERERKARSKCRPRRGGAALSTGRDRRRR